jgi:integrase
VALARLRITVDGGELQVSTSARTLRAACDLYLLEARTESQTQRTDRSACRRICATVLPGGAMAGELPLSKVTWREVEAVFAKWVGVLDPKTSSRYASTLSKVMENAKRAGWIRSNPCADARRPKVPTHRPDVPTPGDVRVAVRRAKATDFMLYAYLMGMATIGCRRSELLAIIVADLDLENGFVTIRSSIADGGPGRGTYRKTTKRDDWRDVPLTEQMVAVFREILDRRRDFLAEVGTSVIAPDGYVFSDDPAGATWLRPDSTSQRWLAARGDSSVTFAMLRRYVATRLLDVTSGDYRTVAAITGNSEETLRRWYDAGPNLEKKRAVVRLSRL